MSRQSHKAELPDWQTVWFGSDGKPTDQARYFFEQLWLRTGGFTDGVADGANQGFVDRGATESLERDLEQLRSLAQSLSARGNDVLAQDITARIESIAARVSTLAGLAATDALGNLESTLERLEARVEGINSAMGDYGDVQALNDALERVGVAIARSESVNQVAQASSALEVTLEQLRDQRVEASRFVSENAELGDTQSTDLSVSGTLTIPAGSIGSDELDASAVTSAKLADGSVTNLKIGADAVQNSNVQDGAITRFKLATGAVATGQINNAAVTLVKLNGGIQAQLNQIDGAAHVDANLADLAASPTVEAVSTTVNALLAALRDNHSLIATS